MLSMLSHVAICWLRDDQWSPPTRDFDWKPKQKERKIATLEHAKRSLLKTLKKSWPLGTGVTLRNACVKKNKKIQETRLSSLLFFYRRHRAFMETIDWRCRRVWAMTLQKTSKATLELWQTMIKRYKNHSIYIEVSCTCCSARPYSSGKFFW